MRGLLVLGLLASLASCTDRSFTPVMPEALEVGRAYTVFAATSREAEDNGTFGYGRSDKLSLLELTVSIPPLHTPGDLKFGYAEPNPRRQFTLAGQRQFADADAFRTRIADSVRGLPRGQREVTVFVHGYNATQAETAFRAAQIAHDINLPGALVIYSWPSRASALGYAYDNDSMLFARDGLERLLRDLRASGTNRIILVAHSMGSALTMETLRQMDIADPGWPARELGGLVLVSPDLDIEVFRSQVKRISRLPDPFVLFASGKDRILDLSARLRGTRKQDRLGSIENTDRISDLPIQIVDTTPFSKSAGSSHFVPATSPALIALLNRITTLNQTFRAEDISLTSVLTGRPETSTPRRQRRPVSAN